MKNKLYFVFLTSLMMLFYVHCDASRIFGRPGSGGSSRGDGHGVPNPSPRDDRDGDGYQSRWPKDSTTSGNNGGTTSGNNGGTTSGNNGGTTGRDNDCPDGGASYSELEDEYGRKSYAKLHTFKNIQDYRRGKSSNYQIEDGRVFVDLNRESRNYYSGEVTITYELKEDRCGSVLRRQTFRSGYGSDARYNVWSDFLWDAPEKRLGFHGFFSNSYQSLILVIERLQSIRTDSDPGSTANSGESIDVENYVGSGSIWFKSFKGHDNRGNQNDCYEGGNYIDTDSWPNPPSKKCWFISIGPFDCRAWIDNNGVDTFRSLIPNQRTRDKSCYKKLADFKGSESTLLFINEAFNDDVIRISSP